MPTETYKYMFSATDPNRIIRAYALGNNKKKTKQHCEKMLREYLESKKGVFHLYKWDDYKIEQSHPPSDTSLLK